MKRYDTLDIMRGLALFGILLINIPAYETLFVTSDEAVMFPETTTLDIWISIIIEKKFFSIFSFLFGVGFFIFASRAEQKGRAPLSLFSKRLLFLLLFGIFHFFLFFGSILPIYAVIGFFLLPFYRRSTKTIASWIIVLLAFQSLGLIFQLWFPSINGWVVGDMLVIFIMFLTGLYVGKKGWLEPTEQMQRLWTRVVLILLPVALLGGVLTYSAASTENGLSHLVALFAIPTAYAYIALFFLLFNDATRAKRWSPIGAVGKMAFTNYFMQNLLGVALIKLFQLQTVTSKEALWLAVIIYGIEVIWSVLYFKKFRIGPLEWIWRKFTYGFRSNAYGSYH